MNIETWFVLTVAAAFLLLGIAGSPLAWVALHHRKSQSGKPDGRAMERADRRTAPARGPARPGRRRGPIRQRKARAWLRPRTGQMAEVFPTAVPLELAPSPPSRASSLKKTTRP